MFASNRFQFETPNVIDPGDAPPSHPSRSLSTEAEHFVMEAIDDDIRLKATRLLSEPNESPSSFVTKSYKLTSSYDDEEEGRASQLPSVEDARMYAVSVLSASTERSHSPIFVRQNKGDSTAESLPLSLDRTVKLRTASRQFVRQRLNHRVICCIVTVAVALTVILLGVVLGTRSSHAPPAPYTRFQKAVIVLGQSISDSLALYTEGTPQYKAAEWIANQDQLQYPIPSLLGADNNRFLQRYILAVLYFALNGDKWTSDVNFLSANDECGWSDANLVDFGVSCSESLQVQSINIYGNNLRGSLPAELQHLSSLQYLTLRDNFISGSIPSSFSALSLLEHLDLRQNDLVGRFPAWFGQLRALKVLGLFDNILTGSLPTDLSGLQQLTTLDLGINELQGSVEVLGQLLNLEYLYLDTNQFTGRLDEGIFDGLQSLIELSLAENNFEASTFPSSFLSLPKLRVVDFSVNSISGTLPKVFSKNTVLEYLTLSDNRINGTIPTSIESLVALRQLDLSQNHLSGTIPYRLNELAKLQYLYLDQNNFKPGPFPQLLGSMQQLRELSLADTGLTGTIPYWIKSLRLLDVFDVRNNNLEGSLPSSLFAEMTSLQYLLLSRNSLQGSLPTVIALTNLQIVALHENSLSGSAAGFCDAEVPTITYDCNEVECNCCNLGCCLRGVKGACYDQVNWVQDLGLLEHNYSLTTKGF